MSPLPVTCLVSPKAVGVDLVWERGRLWMRLEPGANGQGEAVALAKRDRFEGVLPATGARLDLNEMQAASPL